MISVDFRAGAASSAGSSSPLTNFVKLPSKVPQSEVSVLFWKFGFSQELGSTLEQI